MITLYGVHPGMDVWDGSLFVNKAHVLLKMSGLSFEVTRGDFRKAPKGKVPYIQDGDLLLGDSTFIRDHLEKKYGIDLSAHLSPEEKAVAWAFEKMLENELYWAIVHSRWMIDANFERGPKRFFNEVPALIRPFVVSMIRRKIKTSLHAAGMGRHEKSEIEDLARRDLEAVSRQLGQKPWLMGDKPCGADASVWASVASALSPTYDTPIRTAAESYPNLTAYRDRGLALWFKA